MRKILLTITISVFIAALTYVPLVVSFIAQQHIMVMAQTGNFPTGPGTGNLPGGNGPGTGNLPTGPGTGNMPSSANCNPSTQLCNPLLNKYDTLCKVLTGILNLITQIGAIIAVIFIIWSGFKFILAQGNEAKLTAAKKSFMTTIIGTALLLGASVIAEIVVKTVFEITNKANAGVC